MGVPKFFRYISERYPCLSELAREQSIPEFDNLYLDMNGIIHNCSHPDDTNIHFSITEENIFKDIFNYIDKLFFLIKPQQLFFMAVDGVAPRAKMNQQRSRRFRSAKDAELLEQAALRKGEERVTERFDSNCITPGTVFMMRLHAALQYFIKSKISADPLWQKCRVILSGQNVPGEGEHKIMDYIRYLKAQPDYNPNTRHCLYGLDADLTILGLCTHELHFVVLREEVKFGRKPKRASVEETRFFLLHLGLFREYLELEFASLRYQNNAFDIAQLIDDWVLMGFLVGNDFIPHLPCLHISSNALPLLYNTYKKVYPTLGGNINEHGKLNLERLQKYFVALAEVEYDKFQEGYVDLKYFEAKQTKNGEDEAFAFNSEDIRSKGKADDELAALSKSSCQSVQDDENDEDLSDNDGKHIAEEFQTYKRNYYTKKLNEDNMCSERKREQAIGYITALQWILDYYYGGVQSWDWYYPHHYAPFISDLTNFKDHVITFNMGEPFRPFEQLLAVLPAASKQLLPLAYQELMTSVNSSVIDYYPNDFQTDLNGKKHEWEAVVLIPFIDEKVLLRAMKACESRLTPGERLRNEHGPMLQYDYTAESQGTANGIYSMKPLYSVHCTVSQLWAHDIAIDCKRTVCVELPNAARHVFFPGFPTMKHLEFKFELRTARIRVFDSASRNENMILIPQNRPDFDDVYFVAEKYLNETVYIGWPHLIKAKVVGVFDANTYIRHDFVEDIDSKTHLQLKKTAEEHLMMRMGIQFQDFSVMVHVCIHVGTSLVCDSSGQVLEEDSWSPTMTAYPAQGIVAEIAVHDAQQQERKIEELFPVDSMIFFLGHPYYGSEGTVVNPLLIYDHGRLMVNITVLPEPDFTTARFFQFELAQDYVSTNQAAALIGIHSKCLGRITGTLLLVAGARRSHLADNVAKVNVGLQLKYPKQNEERAGYARRINNVWYYSSKAIAIVQAYYKRYPMVIDHLSTVSDRNEFCFETDLFPANVGEGRIEEICAWIKKQDHMTAERVTCGSKTLEEETVQHVIDAVEHLKHLPVKTVRLQVKPHLLLKPDVTLPSMYEAPDPIKLFDRVAIVRTTYMVPLGSKGTVIGIYPVSDPNPVRLECVNNVDNFYEILFDKRLPFGNDIYGIAEGRVYKVPSTSVLLISTQDNAKNELLDRTKKQPREDQKQKQQQPQPQSQSQSQTQPQPHCSPQQHPAQQAQQQRHGPSVNGGAQSYDPTVLRKGGDDFWMPAADTKAKHIQSQNQPNQNSNHDHAQQHHNTSDTAKEHKPKKNASNGNGNKQIQILQKGVPLPVPVPQQQQQHVQQQQPPPSLAQMQAPILPMSMPMPMSLPQSQLHAQLPQNDSAQEKTLMLKNLLGLTKPADDCDKREAPRKLLPQPPQGWRTDAQTRAQMPSSVTAPAMVQFLPHLSTTMPPSRAQYNHGYMIIPMRPPTFGPPRMPIGDALQQSNIPQPYTQLPAFYPIMPAAMVPPCAPADNSCFSPESLNQKGAFIPLQAMRNGPSSQPSSSSQQTKERTAAPKDAHQPDELLANLSELKVNATPDRSPSSGSPLANNAKDTPEAAPIAKAERKRAPRVPKIGARFDNMH